MVPGAAAAFQDHQDDAEGDVFVSGNAPELRHLDVHNVTGSLDGVVFEATLRLAGGPQDVGGNDSLNYQVLLDVRPGTGDGYPAESGWDASIVCRHLDGVRPQTCSVHGADGSVQSAGFQGPEMHLEAVFEAGFQAEELTLGAGAAQQRSAGQEGFTAFDFTPNADIEGYINGTDGRSPGAVDDAGAEDEGPPWLGIAAGAVLGIAIGAWWARRRRR